jgi:hypothetical protein
MLAAAFDDMALGWIACNIRTGKSDLRQTFKAIFDAIAGDERGD